MGDSKQTLLFSATLPKNLAEFVEVRAGHTSRKCWLPWIHALTWSPALHASGTSCSLHQMRRATHALR
jgi:hypothetical protein